MKFNIATVLLFWFSALTSWHGAGAAVFVWMNIPNDIKPHRSELKQVAAVSQQREQLDRIAITVLSAEDKSVQALANELGEPTQFDRNKLARPVSSEPMLNLAELDPPEMHSLTRRARYFQLDNVGGIYVFADADGNAIAAIVFLVNESRPTLNTMNDLQALLEWERSRINKLAEWLDVDLETP